jgi:hypothetical protein
LWRGLNERWVRDRESALKAKLLLDLLYADEEYELAKGNAEWEAAELGVVKLGDITMVTVPGEPFTGTLNTIKARLSGKASGASMNISALGILTGTLGISQPVRLLGLGPMRLGWLGGVGLLRVPTI